MTTQLPATARTPSPCPIVELAFQRIEALCPEKYQKDLLDRLIAEAREIAKCETNGRLQKARAESLVHSALAILAGPDMATTGERMAGISGRAAYALCMYELGREKDAVVAAMDVYAWSIPFRRGDDAQKDLWGEVIDRVGAMRRMG